MRFLRECTADRARRNTLVKYNLCRYSHGLIKSLSADEQIDYAAETAGMFYLYGDEEELEAGFAKTSLLRETARTCSCSTWTPSWRREPVLAQARDQIAGAIYGAEDTSGDCEKFTEGPRGACRKLGVEFLLGRTINGLRSEAGAVTAVQTTNGDVTATATSRSASAARRSAARSA